MRSIALAALVACAAACGLPPGEVCDEGNNPCSAGLSCIRGVCLAPTCEDGIRDGNESDVDCGGSCGPCSIGERCLATADCSSSTCLNNLCSCPVGQHASGTDCVTNTDTTCGPASTDCTRTFSHGSGACNVPAGSCVLTACNGGNHVCSGQCVSNASPQSCGQSECGACASPANGFATCSNDGCGMACLPGYHLSNSACEADVATSCGPNRIDCTNTTAFPHGTFTCAPSTAAAAAKCTPIGCNNGFHASGDSCVADAALDCGIAHLNCPALAPPNAITMVCSDTGSCAVGTCATGYHVNSSRTKCDVSSDTCCGGPSLGCNNCQTAFLNGGGVCTVNANAPNGACTVSTCQAYFHPDPASNSCVLNRDTSCGTPPANCQTIPNGTGSCNNQQGTCNYTCNPRFHLSGSVCELNTDTNCGAQRINCTAQYANGAGACDALTGTCHFVSCYTGFNMCNGATTCQPETARACGPACDPCATNEGCSQGICKCIRLCGL